MSREKVAISAPHLQQLKEEIVLIFQKPVASKPDCEALAVLIEEKTGRMLSTNTLRRFFGLIPASSQPSQQTLDTLAQFAGYDNWYVFVNKPKQKGTTQAATPDWEGIREEAQRVTNFALYQIRQSAGLPYEVTIARPFLTHTMRDFVHSSATGLILYAPSGFGKSVMLAHWTEEILAEQQDIVWFVRGDTLHQTLQQGFSIENWLYQPLEIFQMIAWFDAHPKARKGNMFFVIDNFSFSAVKGRETVQFYQKILEFVQSVHAYAWFKVILSVQVPVYEQVLRPICQPASNTGLWYQVPKVAEGKGGNVPLLSEEEVAEVVSNFDEYHQGQTTRQEVLLALPFHMLDLLRTPYYLQIFLCAGIKDYVHIQDELSLLQMVLHKQLHEGLYHEEKAAIVQTFLEIVSSNPGVVYIEKKQLDRHAKYFTEAYEDLLKNGLLKEVHHQVNIFTTQIQVHFTNPDLLALLLLHYYTERHKQLEVNLANELCERYCDSTLLPSFMKWLILTAFQQEDYAFLKKIFQINYPFQGFEYTHEKIFPLIITLGMQLRASDKARKMLWESYAQSGYGQSHYFELFVDIDYLVLHHHEGIQLYKQYKKTPEGQLFSDCLLFFKSFLAMEKEQCTYYYRQLEAVPYTLSMHPTPLGRKLAYTILYQHFYGSGIEDYTLEALHTLKERVPRQGRLARHLPSFHTYVAEALNWCGYHKEAIALINQAFEHYPLSDHYIDQPTVNRLFVQQASALSQLNEVEQAKYAFYQAKPYYFDVFSRQFDLMNYYLAESQIWKNEGLAEVADMCIHKAQRIAQHYHFKCFAEQIIPAMAG